MLYCAPPNCSVGEALYLIFEHYSTPWKGAGYTVNTGNNEEDNKFLSIDGQNFARMCKEAPELVNYIGRTDIDLIFSRSKGNGFRRLDYDHFLDTLLELSVRIFPEDDPTLAFSNFIAKFIFALFDQPPAENEVTVIENILGELVADEN